MNKKIKNIALYSLFAGAFMMHSMAYADETAEDVTVYYGVGNQADFNPETIKGYDTIYGIYAPNAGTSTTVDDVSVTVNGYDDEGAKFQGNVYGIASYAYNDINVLGDIDLDITGVDFVGYDGYSKWVALVMGNASIDGDYTVSLTDVEIDSKLLLLYDYDAISYTTEDGTKISKTSYEDFYVDGDVTLTIDGNSTIDGYISVGLHYASSGIALDGSSIRGDVTVNLGGNLYVAGSADGDFSNEGVMVTGSRRASIDGNIEVNVTGGTYDGNITAGSNSGTVGTILSSTDTETAITTYSIEEGTGNVEINISDGTFNAEIFAGSHNKISSTTNINADALTAMFGEASDVFGIDGAVYGGATLGDVVVNISGGTFNSDIYAGASSLADGSKNYYNLLAGSATVNISGDAVFSADSTIYGGFALGGTELNFNAYDNSASGNVLNVTGFDSITIKSGSNITMGNYTATNDDMMYIYTDHGSVSTYTLNLSNVSYSDLTATTYSSTFDRALINFSADSVVSISDSYFNNNDITGYIGSLINGETHAHSTAKDTVLNIDNTEFKGNSFTATLVSSTDDNDVTTYSYSNLYNAVTATTVNITNSIFEGNATYNTDVEAETTYYGLSVYGALLGGSSINVSNTEFINNSTDVQTNSGAFVYGTVSSTMSGSTATYDNVLFEGTTATSNWGIQGGVLHTYNASFNEDTVLTVKNSTFLNNTSITDGYAARGGAVTNYLSTAIFNNVLFEGNSAVTSDSAKAEGGAFFAKKDASISTLTNVTFTGNYVSYTGEETTFVGDSGNDQGYARGGAIFLADGADITYNVTSDITNTGNYVSINGTKTDEWGGFLFFGDPSYTSTATFDVDATATLTIGNGTAGYDSIASEDSSAVIKKEGDGSMVVNSSMQYYTGTLNVNDGDMTINNVLGASVVTIESGATLTMGITSATSTTGGIFTNEAMSSISGDGTLTLSATATATGSYTVFANEKVDISGLTAGISTFGGTYYIDTNTFTTAALNTDVSLVTENANLTIGSDTIRVSVSTDESSNDTAVYMAFQSDASATLNSVTDVSTNESFIATYTITATTSAQIVEESAAYSFDLSNYASDDDGTVLLSMYVGVDTYDVSQFTIYHADSDGDWSVATDLSNVTYADGYVSFEVSHFSSYGYTVTSSAASAAVPEPSTYAMIIGVLALGFAAYRRRK